MNKPTRDKPVQILIIKDEDALRVIEKNFRTTKDTLEIMPFAQNNSYSELVRIIPDRNGAWNTPLAYIMSLHNTINGTRNICDAALTYMESISQENPCDILSISSVVDGNFIILKILIRCYRMIPDMKQFYNDINEVAVKELQDNVQTGNLVIPDNIRNYKYTEEEIAKHQYEYEKQSQFLNTCSKEKPFLNSIQSYVRKEMYNPEDTTPLIYDLKTKDSQMATVSSYSTFINVFNRVMTNYITGTEYNDYISVLKGTLKQETFMSSVENYIRREYVVKGLFPTEDIPILLQKIERSLFQLYIIQDLIDDPDVTDIKITAPDSIRVRVKGKAYLSNVTFIDINDYLRFVASVLIKNNIDGTIPSQTFTDQHDENYVLRFSYTASYINSPPIPILHIRKVSRKKLLGDDLIKKGMMDEKIRDYLLDCGKNSRGVVFAGPPGSGKTVALNWFLEEAYEQSAEILVIQENDELFTYKKGVMFEHVVNNPSKNEEEVSLEKLGQLALVAGANVFIIGEAKGAEICSAITLSNSGCRTAITIHSQSSTETIDKMADLAMRGYAQSYEQAKRMMKSFETIVYMQDFKVQEISRIIGYDEEKKDMIYQYIYRRDTE